LCLGAYGKLAAQNVRVIEDAPDYMPSAVSWRGEGVAVVIGHIKHTSKNQDYRFVTGEDQVDYFLHVRDTPDKNIPLVGTSISFDVTTGKDARPRAVNATPIDPVPVESWRTDL
jgi:hypothetical protein